MSGAVEPETGRPRPLSGTLWTLFSWLRRDDAGSSDSLSSAGSDRSAASFAFLSPAHFRHSAPVPRPPPPPPTDSYKKRVHDRNLRRQHDRDLTLHRKYGLFRGDTTIGYDVTSLPLARRSARSNSDKQDRERRAISESLQRRTPYVPGKRRAPLPPVQAAAGTSATLPYRHSRKRRAPQPPIKIEEKAKENFEEVQGRTGMNPTPGNSKLTLPSDVTIGCKSEKYVKKKQHETTEIKSKPEKSFLKQIFENNKKRRSAIETTMRILPSISELDKQAAEIIETSRFKEREQNLKISKIDEHGERSDMTKRPRWICVTCLRCFDESINTCSFCLSSQKPINNFVQEKNRNVANTTQTSKNLEDDERQQLKKMLKEMKDSLPKKQKPVEDIFARDVPVMTASLADKGPVTISETPTLCVRSKHQELNLSAAGEPSPSKKVLEESKNIPKSDNTNEIVRKILLQGTVKSTEKLMKNITNNTPKNMMRDRSAGCKIDDKTNRTECLHLSDTKQISTPLKISSLLNPVYIPKQLPVQPNTFSTNTSKNEDDNVVSKHTKNVILNETSQNKTHIVPSTSNMLNIIGKTTVSTESQTNSANQKSITTKVDEISQHSRRRELINQLEKSIAEGDERAAADAAAKLAQLRLSCSVLSFTSQILSNKDNAIQQTKETVVKNENQILKGPSALNICVTNSTVIPASSKTPEINSVRKLEPNNKQVDKPETSSSKSPLKTDASASHSQVVHGNGAHMVLYDNVVSKHTKNVILNETSQNKTHIVPSTSNMLNIIGKTTVSTESQTNSANQKSITTKVDEISQHSRRRELINQLEKSIAEGDERAAADAAAKLAQLRLSCSVLSFTSQILSNKDNAIQQTKETVVKNENQILKGPSALNICVTNSTVIPASSKTPEINSVRKLEPNNKQVDKPETSSSKSPLKTDASASHSQVVHGNGAHMVFISVWIEDKNATRGPLKLQINRNASVGLLRGAAEAGLGIARELQRWIVGRTLCLDDATPLVTLAGEDLDAPFYLCVVEFDSKQKASIKDGSTNSTRKISSDIINTKNNDRTGDVYTELMQLERQALVPNGELFECEICMEPCPVGHGAVLRECVHSFCRNCLADMIRHCEEPAVSCPAMGCPGTLHEREIRALITPEEYERWLAKGLAFAESGTRNAFHCRTRDCTGWALCDAGVRKFPCPVCKHINCVPCQAIHEGDTCEKYRSKLQQTANQVSNQTDEVTKALLDSLISRGEALECPECSAIITKKWGCDWVKCSACKTEICWVTRGRRWGPGGRGDTSAGCRCGVEGKRCHPSCGYCH
ncbi:uncharacterized protein LOC106129020 [Amyelois transitella]|uniref:uncharacterized protein LOC106129020 n=1 Tax=Amyelois transitella TaxID=680683 RepID=UPI00298F66D1|nr:uncharacterized protein LOC106129020 [Amyelois transitella]